MHEKCFRLTKMLTIISSFYGQIAPRTPEVAADVKKTIINKYIYITQLSLAFTMIMLMVSFLITHQKSRVFVFLLPNVIIYELIVVTVWWSLYFISPVLILGEIGMKKENFSWTTELCQHLFPLFGLFVLFCETPLQQDTRRYFLNFGFAIFYALLLRYNKSVKGKYPYCFLDKMTDLQVSFIFVPSITAIFSVVLYGIVCLNIVSQKWARSSQNK